MDISTFQDARHNLNGAPDINYDELNRFIRS